MGRQSARLYFQGKDHKDIYFNGHYHDQMYLSDGEGNATLVWEKIKEGIFKFLIMPIDTFEFWVQGSVHIDWGDGESSDFEGVGTIKKCRHSYTKSAKFMVQIRGDIQNISFGLGTAENDLIEILTKFPKTMEKATGMAGLFSVNKNLERIPAGLFDNCPNVESFHNTFLGCVSLKNIPAGLFDNCPNVKNFRDTFGSCSSLERIPAGLFDNCPNVESFQSTFNGCSNIKEIPKGLFKNCPEAVQFQQTFSRCSGLTSIPSDIFADSINMSIFSETFYDCFNLTYIPSGLFDGRPNVESFKRTFAYCRNVVSNVPELWKTHGSTKEHAACFNGCDKAENFKDIPASWYYE
jgi:hypothetical protein